MRDELFEDWCYDSQQEMKEQFIEEHEDEFGKYLTKRFYEWKREKGL